MTTFLFLGSLLGLLLGFVPLRSARAGFSSKRLTNLLVRPVAGSLILFGCNMLLFCAIAGLWLALSSRGFGYAYLLLPAAGIGASILLWRAIGALWGRLGARRFGMAFAGSSFYLALLLVVVYECATIMPAFEGDDLFMKALGLMLLGTIAFAAFALSFVITGWKGKNRKQAYRLPPSSDGRS